MPHRLVVIGDSLSQGFMSGAIHRTDLAWPSMVSQALGVGTGFVYPDFVAEGGLPLNLERILGGLSQRFGSRVRWWQAIPAALTLRRMMDSIEDHWERGPGTVLSGDRTVHHNLAVWGFEVRDAFTVSEEVCTTVLGRPRDQLLRQVPEFPMYRTARRVLNPAGRPDRSAWSQVDVARSLGVDAGIESLLVMLGANNALGTVTSLAIRWSEAQDLDRLPHERTANLYRPEHFEVLVRRLADAVATIDAERVFVGTVPHVTIPPATRGVSPGGTDRVDGYFEFYTRPWIWDDEFDPEHHQHLTREQARLIDQTINAYNDTIRAVAAERGWRVIDICRLLDDLAFRRSHGRPAFTFPAGLIDALRAHPRLSYLVGDDGSMHLDTRFIRSTTEHRIDKGGLFSLDGIHPTTIGYGLAADLVVTELKRAGVSFPGDASVDWEWVVNADTLVGAPPAMLTELQACLRVLDRKGLLRGIFGAL